MTQDYWFRTVFRVRVHEAAGDSFQLLFNKLMHYWDERFQSITPWGNWGDGGNDGWIPEEGHYHQIYGPKAASDPKDTASTALNKAIDDFNKLPAKWSNVRRYSFVMNDRFAGMPAPIERALQKLELDKQLAHAGSISSSQLLDRFMSLGEEKRHDVVGFVPEGDESVVNPTAMGELLFALANGSVGHLSFLKDGAPDFGQKLIFNGLTSPVTDRIRSNATRIHVVDAFLQKSDLGSRQAISQEIHAYYEDSKQVIAETNPEAANDRYTWLVHQLIPPEAKKHPHTTAAYRDAAEIVVAKYFETCDVYEHPDSPTAPQTHDV
jgi:hypothetical protein